MNSLLRICSSSLFHQILKPKHSITNNLSLNKTSFNNLKFRIRSYSSPKKTKSVKLPVKSSLMDNKVEKEFFVVRKGDLVGVYNSLSDCQAQVGSSICDYPVSVYKGSSMPQNTEEYLLSCGLKDALYSIRAADLKEDLFGPLVACPFQLPSSTQTEVDASKKRSFEAMGVGTTETVLSTPISSDLLRMNVKQSCIIEFDGASKGNPGRAGAGAVLKTDDGSVICRVREGLGTATNNVAEYRAMILGLRYALEKGFKNIRVVGDSKLVCMQIQKKWKVKDENLSTLYKEAEKLKDKFLSFEITHVLRASNADADVQANLGATLPDGEIQVDFA